MGGFTVIPSENKDVFLDSLVLRIDTIRSDASKQGWYVGIAIVLGVPLCLFLAIIGYALIAFILEFTLFASIGLVIYLNKIEKVPVSHLLVYHLYKIKKSLEFFDENHKYAIKESDSLVKSFRRYLQNYLQSKKESNYDDINQAELLNMFNSFLTFTNKLRNYIRHQNTYKSKKSEIIAALDKTINKISSDMEFFDLDAFRSANGLSEISVPVSHSIPDKDRSAFYLNIVRYRWHIIAFILAGAVSFIDMPQSGKTYLILSLFVIPFVINKASATNYGEVKTQK